MRSSLAALLLATATAGVIASAGCNDEPPARTGPEPMRAPAGPRHATPVDPTETENETGTETESAPKSGSEDPDDAVILPERPRADPDIERALDLIGASGLTFVDPASDPEDKPSEYSAEQFSALLRTKWDWLGYDLTELEPWLDGVATRSFKSNLAYQVVLTDGTRQGFRAWIDAQLRDARH